MQIAFDSALLGIALDPVSLMQHEVSHQTLQLERAVDPGFRNDVRTHRANTMEARQALM